MRFVYPALIIVDITIRVDIVFNSVYTKWSVRMN